MLLLCSPYVFMCSSGHVFVIFMDIYMYICLFNFKFIYIYILKKKVLYKKEFHEDANGSHYFIHLLSQRTVSGAGGMEQPAGMLSQARPYIAVILQQFITAGMVIISKFALNQGLNQHVLVVYRYTIATIVVAPFAFVFERKVRPKMTWSIFGKVVLLGLLE